MGVSIAFRRFPNLPRQQQTRCLSDICQVSIAFRRFPNLPPDFTNAEKALAALGSPLPFGGFPTYHRWDSNRLPRKTQACPKVRRRFPDSVWALRLTGRPTDIRLQPRPPQGFAVEVRGPPFPTAEASGPEAVGGFTGHNGSVSPRRGRDDATSKMCIPFGRSESEPRVSTGGGNG